MTTTNNLLNELRDEIRKLGAELEDLRTPEWRKMFIRNRLEIVSQRLEGLAKEVRDREVTMK